MTAFSIDDVRETMPREVRAFLGGIEGAAEEFLQAYANYADVEPQSATLLRSMRHYGHAIYGTSSLVSATTLAACADLVERLAERGHAELIEAQERMHRARLVVELLPRGVGQMRRVLDLALEHADEAASALAKDWQREAESLLSELQNVPQQVQAPSLYPDADSSGEDPQHAVGAEHRLRPEVLAGPELLADSEIEIDELSDSDLEFTDASDERSPLGTAEPTEFRFEELETGVPSTQSVPELALGLDAQLLREVNIEVVPTSDGALAEKRLPLKLDAANDLDSLEPQEFGFEEDARPSARQAELEAELVAIFHEEAREAVVALQGYFNQLASDEQGVQAAQRIERVYHTLKGAAATIGLQEVSALAEALQVKAERVLFAKQPPDAGAFEELVSKTNELFERAGLDDVRVTVPVPTQAGPASLALAKTPVLPEFVQEAKEIYEQASTLVAELSGPGGSKFTQSILVTLGSLFHRLTGSARLAGSEKVGELAEALQQACEGSERPSTAELSLGLARISATLGLGLAPRKVERPDEARFVTATRATFEKEAAELVDKSLQLVKELQSDAPSERVDQEKLAELGRQLHHLTGSARIVGHTLVAEEARNLEQLARSSRVREQLTSLADRLLVLRTRFGGTAQPGPLKRTAATIRESIEFANVAELWQTFTIECSELLETIERTTFELEDTKHPRELLKTLMRLVHTLKGVVNTIGMAPTGRILHRVEDVLESLLESDAMPPVRNVASLLIEVQAEVRRNLKEAPSGYVETSPARLEARVLGLHSTGQTLDSLEVPSGSLLERSSAGLQTGSGSAAHSGEEGDRRVIRVSTDRLDSLMNLAGELVVSRSRLASRVERLRSLQVDLVRGGRRLLDTVDTFREENEFANLDGRRRELPGGQRDRLAAAAQDDVVGKPLAWGTFGELELDRYEGIHILTRSLAELTSDFSELHGELLRGLSALNDDADTVGGIVSGIQTEVTRARMVPLDLLFMRLRLPLRDAAFRERKDVRVVVSGEDVPVDKSIADALFQPMLHLVRNAVAHGIEGEDVRVRRGKERFGTIGLSARHESGQIVIEVRDDGGGLDRAALLAKGIEMGVLPSDVTQDDPRVGDMVFVQGLSTQRTVGDVAGRGVGGDVVRRAVDRLNGSVRVQSEPDKGTSFTIRLPLTLAITRALIVSDGQQSFAIPLHFAERIIDALDQDIAKVGDERRIKLDDVLVPIRTLNQLFNKASESTQGPVLILRVADSRVALQVDSIVANEEVVVKNLGTILAGHPCFSGITIRGTGELVLILDVPNLVQINGSTFTRPLKSADSPARAELASRAGKPAVERDLQAPLVRPKAEKARVLFVDDSVSVRKVAEMHLRELGVDVITAVDGVDAVAKLRENKVDIVFTDLEMPRMHGYELIRELRFVPAYRELPIIVVTSRSGRKHQEQARELGASDYMTKPFTVQQLRLAIRKFVQGPAATELSSSQEGTLS
jgi:chemosensory pili system protein ChpA (sensor histidine kinase/response regulator)